MLEVGSMLHVDGRSSTPSAACWSLYLIVITGHAAVVLSRYFCRDVETGGEIGSGRTTEC